MKKSWKTTATGAGAIVAALGLAVKAQFDGDITTTPDWNLVIMGTFTFLMGLFARDNKVTSEQAGAGK